MVCLVSLNSEYNRVLAFCTAFSHSNYLQSFLISSVISNHSELFITAFSDSKLISIISNSFQFNIENVLM